MFPHWRISRPLLSLVVIAPGLMLTMAREPLRAEPPPIIDVHLHALPINAFGKPPARTCAPVRSLLPRDPRDGFGMDQFASCAAELQSPLTDDALLRETTAMLERFNITAVTSGPIDLVRKWKSAHPDRIIPALNSGGFVPADTVRSLVKDGSIAVLGELGFQYNGIAATDLPKHCLPLRRSSTCPSESTSDPERQARRTSRLRSTKCV